MRVLDEGHRYMPASLDGEFEQELRFVKRMGEGYPGNNSAYPGTTMQEVLRILIHRALYVNNQIPSSLTMDGVGYMRAAIRMFEMRAAVRHDRMLRNLRADIENEPTCEFCGHIQCNKNCRKEKY